MKIRLLIAGLLITLSLAAQDEPIDTTGTFAHARMDSLRRVKVMARQKRFDVGGGVQVNSFNGLGTSAGLLFSFKANAKNGKIAGLFNLSYNLNNHFGAISPVYDYNNYYNTYPRSKFESNVRYNFLKVGAAMQIPFFNRTNKKGFSLAAIVGLSYYNGMGSGQYTSFLDKPNAPSIDTSVSNHIYIRPSQKFGFDNHNLSMFSVDLGLSLNYTFDRYQVFADFSTLFYGVLGNTFTKSSDVPWMQWFGGYSGSNYSYNLNLGVRYCIYYPWQTTPPKHR